MFTECGCRCQSSAGFGPRPTSARTCRLIAEDEEESYDDPDLVAYDSGIDGGGASAEEAAVHVVDEEPGEES